MSRAEQRPVAGEEDAEEREFRSEEEHCEEC